MCNYAAERVWEMFNNCKEKLQLNVLPFSLCLNCLLTVSFVLSIVVDDLIHFIRGFVSVTHLIHTHILEILFVSSVAIHFYSSSKSLLVWCEMWSRCQLAKIRTAQKHCVMVTSSKSERRKCTNQKITTSEREREKGQNSVKRNEVIWCAKHEYGNRCWPSNLWQRFGSVYRIHFLHSPPFRPFSSCRNTRYAENENGKWI